MIFDGENDPDHVDQNKDDTQTNQPNRFRLFLLQVEGSTSCAQVGGDGRQGREQEKADNIADQVPLIVFHARLAQPVHKRSWMLFYEVLVVTQFTVVMICRG